MCSTTGGMLTEEGRFVCVVIFLWYWGQRTVSISRYSLGELVADAFVYGL